VIVNEIKITFDEASRRRGARKLGVSTATISLYLGERRKRGILEGLRRRLGRR
jgi:hypothetical protein